jgi:uncharacterized protein YhfF
MNDSAQRVVSERAAALWRAYLAGLPLDHPHRMARITEFSFGDSPALADELAALVVSGRKQATATLAIQFAVEGAPVPAAGDVSIVTRGDGTPVAAIETTDVRVVPFDRVDAAFAHAEGEGDRSLAWWRAAHTAYFGRVLAPLGRSFDGASLVVCERFRLVYVGDDQAREPS